MLRQVSPDRFEFRFWTPVAKAEGRAESPRILEGVASTGRKDLQQETVVQKGLDCSMLLKTGVINWNHMAKNDPGTIIGKPLEAHLNDEGNLHIVGKIFEGIPAADAAWQLAEYYAINPNDGRLGWSIEGYGIRVNKTYPKTFVRHVALTHDPAQPETWASVVKAMVDGLELEELSDVDKTLSTANAGALLLENLDSNGKSRMVNELFFGPVEEAHLVWAGETFRDGVMGLHRQLVAKGMPASDAKDFLIRLRKSLRGQHLFN